MLFKQFLRWVNFECNIMNIKKFFALFLQSEEYLGVMNFKSELEIKQV